MSSAATQILYSRHVAQSIAAMLLELAIRPFELDLISNMESIDIKAQLLEHFPAFRNMANTTVDCVIASSPVKRIPAGTVIFTPGTPCSMFPLVLSGCLRVSMAGAKGRELPLYRVRPGESCILTTTCLLGETAYAATGVAESDTTAIAVSGDGFNRLIEHEPLFRAFEIGRAHV